jgi:ubiquinone biosynthesis accessory factor UbiK
MGRNIRNTPQFGAMELRHAIDAIARLLHYAHHLKDWLAFMFDTKILDELAQRIGEAVRASPAKDVEKNLRALLGSLFVKLDLVTRDEFEVQAQVLLRTREKLEQLEARVAALDGSSKSK